MKPDYNIRTMIALLIGFAIFIAISIDPVYAQTTVDMRPTVNSILEYTAAALTTVLTVLAGFGIRFVAARIGMSNSELEASLMARLNDIIHKGIDYAYIAATNEVNKQGSGLEAVKFDNWFMSLAATYVNRGAPDIIKKFGLSQERIQDMIMARLPAYVAQVPVQGGLPTSPSVKEINRELNVDQGKTTGAAGTGAVVAQSAPIVPAPAPTAPVITTPAPTTSG
jgi:hypothetical protein